MVENFIKIDGLNVAYEETGNPEGEPVIILHGWGCNYTTVRSIANCLKDKMRIISVDMPGHGKSDEPSSVWGTKDFATLISKIITTLDLKKPSVIGHSFGGRTALSLASQVMPDNLNKIVLVDSAGLTPKRSLGYYYKVYSYKTVKYLSKKLLGEEKGDKMSKALLKKRGSDDYRNSSVMMRRVMSKCINEDLRKFFPQIKIPVLLIWGENDTATPVSDARIMEKGIPDAGLVVFPGCGHYSFLDNPLGFKAVVREFFKEELSDKR